MILMVFCWNYRIRDDCHEKAKKNISTAQQRQKKQYDSKHSTLKVLHNHAVIVHVIINIHLICAGVSCWQQCDVEEYAECTSNGREDGFDVEGTIHNTEDGWKRKISIENQKWASFEEAIQWNTAQGILFNWCRPPINRIRENLSVSSSHSSHSQSPSPSSPLPPVALSAVLLVQESQPSSLPPVCSSPTMSLSPSATSGPQPMPPSPISGLQLMPLSPTSPLHSISPSPTPSPKLPSVISPVFQSIHQQVSPL